MQGWKYGLVGFVFCFWGQAAVADIVVGGVTGKPASGVEEMLKQKVENPKTSSDFLFKQNSTPEEDFQAGVKAYDRAEMIEAQGIFERASKRGHTGAMVRLAEILNRAGFVNEAVDWYRKASQLGNSDAMYELGQLYLDLNAYDLTKNGVRTESDVAYKWFKRAAENGHPQSTVLIAMAYMDGGVAGIDEADRTNENILKWMNLAVERTKSPLIMEGFIRAYREGKYGLEIDAKKAEEWEAKVKEARGIKEEEAAKKKKKQRIL